MHRVSRACFFLDSIHYHPPDQRFSYLGADPFLEWTLDAGTVSVSGEENFKAPAADCFAVLRRLFKKYGKDQKVFPFFTGGAVGFFSYEFLTLLEKIKLRKKPDSGVPKAYLGFYRKLVIYDHARKIYLLAAHSKQDLEHLKSYFEDTAPHLRGVQNGETFRLGEFRPETTRQVFEKMVGRAKRYIEAGDIYQANLSQRFFFEFGGSTLDLYERLRQINPSPFASFLKKGDLEIISSSPERLVTKRGSYCETRPIAGTRPRRFGLRSENDLMRELHSNEKERAEHLMLVDLERNDLGRVCDYHSVKVREFMKIEKYSHVLHLVSKVVGRLAKGKDAWDVLSAMFPGGTITGCPKIRCMEIIDELEPVRRGIYTGSLGYMDFSGDMDLNIAIRTLVLQKGKGHLQVGAGIVYDSDPAREFEETLAKGEALAQALAEASGERR